MARDEVAALMAEDAAAPAPQDKLDKLRAAVRELRDIEKRRVDLTAIQTELGLKVREIKTKTIVDLFDDAKIENITIPAEGNNEPFTLGVGWEYKANIGSANEPKVDDYGKSIEYIRKQDPDLLKTTFTIDFGLSEGKKMKAFEAMLKKQKIPYSTNFGVPWNTLTSWLKEQIEVKRKSPNLKLLGATVERIAKIVKPKASKAERAAPKSRKGK
jgi:hypothetical protein